MNPYEGAFHSVNRGALRNARRLAAVCVVSSLFACGGEPEPAARHPRWASVSVPDHLPAGAASPEDLAHRAGVRESIERRLDRLPPMQRTSFRLCDIEGFDGNEVAEMLGVSAATVRTHRHRARQALRDALSHLNDDREV